MRANPSSAVLIADVVGSRRIADFRPQRDRLLSRLSREHLGRNLIVVPYTITSWDEFQTISSDPSYLPDIVWELRRELHPWKLKIGIGIGPLESLPERGEAVNEVSMGEAFVRARDAVNKLTESRDKYRILTRFRAQGGPLDGAINTIYDLLDTLLLGITERQWETIRAYESAGKIEAASRQLEVDESTVSRNLQRGYYWQTVATRERLRGLFSMYPDVQEPPIVQGGTR